jgi:hypothetical protein
VTAALPPPRRVEDTRRQVGHQAAAAQTMADDAVTELWGGAAPPAEVAVLPPPARMLAYGNVREAIASLLIRTVVLDKLPAAGPAVGALVAHLVPVVDWEAGHFGRPVSDDEAEEIVTAPAFVIGSALTEGARAVIAEDRIAAVLEFLEPVLDAALAPLGLSPELTGSAVARALACAAAHAYTFTDPADTALLDRLDPDSTTSENPLETLVNEKLLPPRDTLLTGLAVLAALAGLCRSNAVSVLRQA